MRDATALFLMLYLGHILGDFALQPGRLVVAKRNGFTGALVHTAIVTAVTALIAAGGLSALWPAVLTAGLLHLSVEELTIRARRSPRSSDLTVFFLDQGLHAVALALIALTAAPTRPMLAFWEVSTAQLAAVTAIATVALAGSIVVFEVNRERSSRAGGQPESLLGLDLARVYGWAERGGGLALALYGPVPALGLAAFVPRLLFGGLGRRADRDGQVTAAITGAALCIMAWTLVMLVA